MNPKRVRYAKIDRLVEEVLEKHGITSPAVPIDRIILKEGIRIRAGDLGEVSGLLLRSASQTIVGVNLKQGKVRRRFTMAHEFGHYCLHEGVTSHTDHDFKINFRDTKSSQASDTDEMEANHFAASLLMPRAFLDKRQAAQYLDDDRGVADLAADFEVSALAMSLRLGNLYSRHRPF